MMEWLAKNGVIFHVFTKVNTMRLILPRNSLQAVNRKHTRRIIWQARSAFSNAIDHIPTIAVSFFFCRSDGGGFSLVSAVVVRGR